MTVPGKLEVDAGSGKVTGPAKISYNNPWPCPNGTPGGGASVMKGVVIHTEDGYEQGTIDWFNKLDADGRPVAQASSFFAVGLDGAIWQFGPVGKNWMAWAQAAGNPDWYSIEDADNGVPSVPFTDAQVTAVAQLVEVLSRFAGFPLQVTDSVGSNGVITHSAGGAAWGGHPCPGPVRAAQRKEIVDLAKQIRDHPVKIVHWKVWGHSSLARQAAEHHTTPQRMIELAAREGHVYGEAMKKYIAAADWEAHIPAGTVLFAPER